VNLSKTPLAQLETSRSLFMLSMSNVTNMSFKRQINLLDLSKYFKGSTTYVMLLVICFRPIVWVPCQFVAYMTTLVIVISIV